MIRLILAGFLAFSMAAFAVADEPRPEGPEPPPRLKKKVRPEKKAEDKPAPKKDAPKKKEAAPKEPLEPAEPEGNEKEILQRIEKNIRESGDRLGKNDAGEGTQQTQRDVVKDIDALIAYQRKQQQQQQDQQPSAGVPSGRTPKNQQRAGSSPRLRRERKNRPGSSRHQPEPSAQANQGGAGKNRNAGPSKMAEMYKERWGELPETLRQEMDAYSRERFMARYNDLLKQYYSTIAERGRRRENDK